MPLYLSESKPGQVGGGEVYGWGDLVEHCGFVEILG
jgi:hypothetical protein